MLKIFADECVHQDMISALEQNDFDVMTANQAGLTGSDDESIFNFALENKQILLTFDRGFGDIFRFSIAKSSGVIIMLMSQMSKTETIDILLKFLDFIKKDKLNGKLAIIGKTKIRISTR